jgi:hypothetical protein
MNQKFTFTGKEKMVSLIMAGFGGLLIAIGFLTAGDDAFAWNRVWTNILHNSVFFLGISFLSMFFYAAFTTAYAGWFVVFKRVMEALTAFIPVGGAFIILVAVGAALGWNDIYYWMTEGLTDPAAENFDKVIHGKKGFLNIPYFLASTIGFVVVWTFFAAKFRSISRSEDTAEKGSITTYIQLKKWVAMFLPIGASTSAFAIWYWIMSIEPHWYSTMFAWYATGSLMSCAIAVVMLSLYYLQSRGYYEEVLLTHYHDLGKFLFAFSIFWTYLWFSQYMLIWYANIGEETVHFQNQLKDFPILFYGMLILNFALPLIILMRNTNKYRKGSVIFMCIVILFGHWLDFFLMIKQGVYYELGHAAHAGEGGGHHEMEFMFGYNLPGLIEIGIMLGFLGLFIYVFFNALGKSNLVPTNDPYLEESLHHQGGPLGPELDVHH